MLYDGTSVDNFHNADTTIDGTLTVGAFTIPETDGTNGQVLKTNGGGVLTWSADSAGADDITFTGTAPVAVNELIAFNNTNGLEAKETGINYSDVILRDGSVEMTNSLTLSDNGVKFSNDSTMNITKSGNDLKINSGTTSITINNTTADVIASGVEFNAGNINAYSVDTPNANPLYLGSNDATLIGIGKTGVDTQVIGTMDVKQTATFNVKILTDAIEEKTLNNGVDVDGLTIKKTGITTDLDTSNLADNLNLGVTRAGKVFIGGATIPIDLQGDTTVDTKLAVDTINELTTSNGVSIDSVICKDAEVFSYRLDPPASGVLDIGNANATIIGLARSGITTQITGLLDAKENATFQTSILTDTIVEKTTANGVDVEQVKIKDNTIDLNTGTGLQIGGTTATSVNVLTNNTDTLTCNGGLKFRTNPIRIYANDNNKLCVDSVVSGLIQCWDTGLYSRFYFPIYTDTITTFAANAMSIGTTTATAVNLGASGTCPTEIKGDFKHSQEQLEAYYDTDSTTTITTLNTWTPTTFTGMTQRAGATGFTMDTTTTYGEITVDFSDRARYCHSSITVSCRLAAVANRVVSFSVWRTDGTPAMVSGSEVDISIRDTDRQSTAIHFFPAMSSGQKYRLYCKNVGGTEDIVISHVNFSIVATPNVV